EGPAGSFTVTPTLAKPNAPGTVSATKNADGSVTLKWSLPAAGGPEVKFFRIYRGSTEYTSRYAATAAGTETSYTDFDATTTNNYWITAVDQNLTESEFKGPVAG